MRRRALLVAFFFVAAACGQVPPVIPSAPSPASASSRIAPTPSSTPTIGSTAPVPSDPPTVGAEPSPIHLPTAGGTCAAGQIVPGVVTDYGPGFGGPSMYVTLPIRNVGNDCVLHLPAVIGVAPTTGPTVAVKVVDAGTTTAKGDNSPAMSARIRAGDELSIEIGAWWGGFGAPSGCNGAIRDVTRVELPLATGTLVVDLPTVFKEVCTSPASVSLMIEGS